jgi:predicted AlkP superfamily pyrophosphatase or phosphodiesterase
MKLRAMVVAAMLATTTIPSAAAPPKLIVLVVVDQMRADYVDRFQGEWTSGLKRLIAEGAWYSRAAYPYLTTVTCAGHATIGSGAYPHLHGVFQNVWYDRGRKAIVTCTQDSNANPLPYGRSVTGGESAAMLTIPNFADEMRRQRQSRVVSVALMAQSAIMLAGHGGSAVTWMNDSLDGWETSSAYAVEPVHEVRAYLSAHPIEADYGKTWNRLLPAENYTEPDAGLAESTALGWSTTFPHVLKGSEVRATADPAFYDQWQRSPFADAYVARMALGLTESFGLGQTDRTDVLAISFSSPDLVGHSFGPDSQEVHDMYAQLDRTMGLLLDGLDRMVGRDQYVLALSADHGVTPIPEQLVARGKSGGRLDAAPIVAAIEQTARAAAGPGKYVARVIGNDVYFENGMFERVLAAPAAIEAVMASIGAVPGVNRVVRGDQLTFATASSSDRLLRAAALSAVPGRSGDLVIVPKEGWMFAAAGTTHGNASADDQRVPLILFGQGIRRGEYRDQVTPADIAPTLAAIAGIRLPYAEGQVLRSAVADLAGAGAAVGSER